MIVIADTTPLISLMKIGHLDLINQLFGEIQIPNTVFNELVHNTRFPDESKQILEDSLLLMDEVKGRQVAKQMGIQLMGTIGMLLAAYKSQLLSKEEILECINILKTTGRHISNKLYKQLMEKLT